MHCKTVGVDSQRAGAGLTGPPPIGPWPQEEAVLTALTEVSCAVVLAVYTNAGDVLAVVGVSFAITRQTEASLAHEKAFSTDFLKGLLLPPDSCSVGLIADPGQDAEQGEAGQGSSSHLGPVELLCVNSPPREEQFQPPLLSAAALTVPALIW